MKKAQPRKEASPQQPRRVELNDIQEKSFDDFVFNLMHNKDGSFHFLSPQAVPELTINFQERLYNAMLSGEMECHLKEEQEISSDGWKNKRNGYSPKTLLSTQGKLHIQVPRDRASTYTPLLIPKYSRKVPEFNNAIVAMYARGMSERDIKDFVREQYNVDVSTDFISNVTDSVIEELNEWRNRDLQSLYPVVFFDALRLSIRDGGTVKKMAVHFALGIRIDGSREVLGLWINENEGAAFWSSVFSELQNRGVEDILIAVTDGLKGMTQALEAVFPETQHQTCIVHLIRSSTKTVSAKDRSEVMKLLKPIYTAVNAEEAERALKALEESDMGKKYPAIARSWRAAWAQVVPVFNFAPQIRKIIYTTNSIESLNRGVRKFTKTRSVFPTVTSAMKVIYLALRNITSEWKRASPAWSAAMPVFAANYGERFTRHLV